MAFDVYQDQVGSYWIRTSEMAKTTVEFLTFTMIHYVHLRRHMDDATDWKSVRQGLNWLLGKPGWLRKLGPAYRAYYKRDFHPSKREASGLRERGLKRLAKMLNKPELEPSAAA